MKMDKKIFTHFSYYDRIVILSTHPKERLEDNFRDVDFKDYCGNKKTPPIYEASHSAMHHGYQGKIDLTSANDDCVMLLTDDLLGKSTISRLEVARDFACESLKQARDLQHAVNMNIFKLWENGRFDYHINDESETNYIGKSYGRKSTNYLSLYSRLSKINKLPVFHIEFILQNWSKIKIITGITHPFHLPPAKHLFDILEKRYIRFPKVNREQYYFHLRKNGYKHDKARYCSNMIKNVWNIVHRLLQSKENIMRKKYMQRLNRKILGRSRNITPKEKKILNMPLSTFLDFSCPPSCDNISTFLNSYFKH